MEIERTRESLSEAESEGCDDEISKHLENALVVQPLVTVHMSADLPLPFGVEEREDVVFIDPISREGKKILSDEQTTVPELFAIMRQPVLPVAANINVIVKEMMKRNVGANDIDITTGMSIFQYVVRSEAFCPDSSGLATSTSSLLRKGANPLQRSLFTDMNSFHVSAYFDCCQALKAIIKNTDSDTVAEAMGSGCSEFDSGTPLHIAAANLSVDVAELLVKAGADVTALNSRGQTPASCISTSLLSNEDRRKAELLRQLFDVKGFFTITSSSQSKTGVEEPIGKRISLTEDSEKSADFHVGDYVAVGGVKKGFIRYIGNTKFSPGVWCGIELDDPVGKNDGSINGTRYFTCEKSRGVFAPLGKVVSAIPVAPRYGSPREQRILSPKSSKSPNSGSRNGNGCDVKRDDSSGSGKLKVGMAVLLDKSKEAIIKFVGTTDFASGVWIGLSLTQATGKNNGTVQGREYFRCKPNHGVMVRQHRITIDDVRSESS